MIAQDTGSAIKGGVRADFSGAQPGSPGSGREDETAGSDVGFAPKTIPGITAENSKRVGYQVIYLPPDPAVFDFLLRNKPGYHRTISKN